MVLVQMSGCPGAGKSTIARELGRHIGGVVVDHDIIKSCLLDLDVKFDSAGRIGYGVMVALVRSFLDQGLSVVIDSPCYYDELLNAGINMSTETGACYRYIECVNENLDVLGQRLRKRTRLRSQRADIGTPPQDYVGNEKVSGEVLFQEWIQNMKRPTESYIRIDTSKPLTECLGIVFKFLDECE